MPILNYTTQVPAEKTAWEIQSMLAKANATAILTDFDDGVLMAISFKIRTVHGVMAFRLPGNVQKIYQVLTRQKGVPTRLRTKAQASRVSWRIIKDWLQAQLALVHSELVDFEQVFLPYAQGPTGQTLYESLVEDSMKTLALPEPPK